MAARSGVFGLRGGGASTRRLRLAFAAALGLAWLPGVARADVVAVDVNALSGPTFFQWCNPGCQAVGWYFTPASSFRVSGIQTNFAAIPNFGSESRTVTVEILTERRAVGGTLLASSSFDSGDARGALGGARFPLPIELQAGTTYFIGFRNVKGLGTNVTGAQPVNPAATVLAPGLYLDTDDVNDGAYEVYAGAPTAESLGAPILRFLRPEDLDGDLVLDPFDNCPTVANASQADTNGDGAGEACADFAQREPNSAITQGTPVACGHVTSSAAITPTGDVDFYRFRGTAGQTVSLDLDAAILGSTLDTELAIFDPSGNRLAFSADGPAPGEDFGTDSYVEVVLPVTGTYFVGVASFPDRDFNADFAFTTGPYTLSIACAPPDPYEPNETPGTASPQSCPFGTENARITPRTEKDVFAFTVPAGVRIVADLDAPAGLDATLTLRSPAGFNVAFSNDDSAPGEAAGVDPYLTFETTLAGTYTIEVASSVGLTTGAYSLQVSCAAGDPYEPNDTRAAATPIACGFASSSLDSEIVPQGDVDWYRFTLSQPTVIQADVDPAGRFRPVLEDAVMGLYTSAGALLATSDDAAGPGEDGSIFGGSADPFLLRSLPAGSYAIAISSYDDFDFDGDTDSGIEELGAGEYGFSLTCSAAPANPIPEIPWRAWDASLRADDESSLEWDLPFAFPFFGRSITRISVSTNGLVELLQAGEECVACQTPNVHAEGRHVTGKLDALFAPEGDLESGLVVQGGPSRVRIVWMGNVYGLGFGDDTLQFELHLFRDGRVRWKIHRLDDVALPASFFAGLYDGVGGVERGLPGGVQSLTGLVQRTFEFTPASGAIAEIPWNATDASLDAADDASLSYTLPFAFPFAGRSIQSLEIGTNGLLELREANEACAECGSSLTHAQGRHDSLNLDALFAGNDDLFSGAVVEGSSDFVDVTWVGHTVADGGLLDGALAFGLTLSKTGDVRWRFYDFDWTDRDGDLFSGRYDGVAAFESEVAVGSTSLFGEATWKAFATGSDSDADGVPESFDDCTTVADPLQVDADRDGYGNVCDADYNNDGIVNFLDLSIFKAAFLAPQPVIDLTGDGLVNFLDLARFKALFLKPPGPSGLPR